jgi:hypothetical protein
MPIKTGFKTITIPFNNLPNTQVSGDYSVQIGTINKGVYIIYITASLQVGSGVGNITYANISLSEPYDYINNSTNFLVFTPNYGTMGVVGTQAMDICSGNIVTISNDNTPLYIHIACTLTGTWGTTKPNSQQNKIRITRIA